MAYRGRILHTVKARCNAVEEYDFFLRVRTVDVKRRNVICVIYARVFNTWYNITVIHYGINTHIHAGLCVCIFYAFLSRDKSLSRVTVFVTCTTTPR